MYFNINLILQRMRNRKKILEWEKQITDTNKESEICRIFLRECSCCVSLTMVLFMVQLQQIIVILERGYHIITSRVFGHAIKHLPNKVTPFTTVKSTREFDCFVVLLNRPQRNSEEVLVGYSSWNHCFCCLCCPTGLFVCSVHPKQQSSQRG